MDTVDDDDTKNIRFNKLDVDKEVDSLIKQQPKQDDDIKEIQHISDKIRFAKQVRQQPPENGFMETKFDQVKAKMADGTTRKGVAITYTNPEGVEEVEFTNGLFSIDLRNDINWFFVRSGLVVPMLLEQGIRTHLDIKKSHEPEKRKKEIPLMLIAIGVVVFFIIFISFYLIMKGMG